MTTKFGVLECDLGKLAASKRKNEVDAAQEYQSGLPGIICMARCKGIV